MAAVACGRRVKRWWCGGRRCMLYRIEALFPETTEHCKHAKGPGHEKAGMASVQQAREADSAAVQ